MAHGARSPLLWLGAALVGCIFSGRVESGVDPTLPLSEVTEEQREALCRAGVRYRYVVTSGNLRCKTVALELAEGDGDAALRRSCIDYQEQCEDEGIPGHDQSSELDACDARPRPPLLDCEEATVGELEDCESDRLDRYSVAVNEAPACNQLTRAALEELKAATRDSAIESCRKLARRCR